jgi:N6-adenosine-specific RNA methylase IME4
VIYADPPWRFEPWSRVTGMSRSADRHYSTMETDAIASIEVPAAPDCVLFLWSTVAMLPDGMHVLAQWGFGFRTAYVWHKPGVGHGYWSTREQVEVLLVGVRGNVPAPLPGTQPPQVITAPRTRHSEKPEKFAAMIEAMFPDLARVELFARRTRAGWDAWGNEVLAA